VGSEISGVEVAVSTEQHYT